MAWFFGSRKAFGRAAVYDGPITEKANPNAAELGVAHYGVRIAAQKKHPGRSDADP